MRDETADKAAVSELRKRLQSERPNQWDAMPDIELYMDQVLGYMLRQHIGLGGKETLTSAMINNYIKNGLLPRANGKKYGREHIAHLTVICLLKQVLSVTDTDALLKLQRRDGGIRPIYETYCERLSEALTDASDKLAEAEENPDVLPDLLLEFAVAAYANKMVCEQLLGAAEKSGKAQKQND